MPLRKSLKHCSEEGSQNLGGNKDKLHRPHSNCYNCSDDFSFNNSGYERPQRYLRPGNTNSSSFVGGNQTSRDGIQALLTCLEGLVSRNRESATEPHPENASSTSTSNMNNTRVRQR